MKLSLFLTAALVLSTTAGADETRYGVYLAGNAAGSMVIQRSLPSSARISFQFNDRGRGPDIAADYVLDESGLPVQIDVTGVDYFKAPVAETLRLNGGLRHWSSGADSGSTDRPGFYLTLDGPPGEIELLVNALDRSPAGQLDLFPVGSARLEAVATRGFDDGLSLRHVELHGLGFEPDPVWLDQNGRMFALISGWLSLVREGHEELVPVLRDIQKERRLARYAGLTKSATRLPDGPVLIDNARILDVAGGGTLQANGVVVRDGVIQSLLLPSDPRPGNVETVDAAGRSLMPGLWDMHTHIDLADGPLQLAAGVTTVRDLANDHEQLTQAIQAFETGIGPHVFKAGIIDGAGPFAGPTRALVEDADDASRWIQFYADNGYHQIKIYSSTPTALVPAMAAQAHEAGLRVSGHVPAGMWAEDAVRAGFDEIQHINMVFLNFYKDIVETRNPDRFIKVAERGADLDPSLAPFQEFVRLLLERGTVVDPTVAVFMNLFMHESGQLAPSLQSAKGRLPPQVHRGNLKGGLNVPAGWAERYSASGDRILEVVKALHSAGVPIVAGTDGLAGFTLHAELKYYQQAGIDPMDILRLATLGSAEVMGVSDQVGRIAPGQRADLILVDGRPDQDIADMELVNWVMKQGRIIDTAAMYRFLSVVPARVALTQ